MSRSLARLPLLVVLWAWFSGLAFSAPAEPPHYGRIYLVDTMAGAAASGDISEDFLTHLPIGLRAAGYNTPVAIVSVNPGLDIVADAGNSTLRRLFSDRSNRLFPSAPPSLGFPTGLALAPDGTLYVADARLHIIRRVSGYSTTPETWLESYRLSYSDFAGSPGLAGSTDGKPLKARFRSPSALALDSAGNLYVADTGNHVIRRITPAGVVTTFAGRSGQPGHADGARSAARFHSPSGIAVDSVGNVYVADTGNHLLRVIRPSGLVLTLAGQAGAPGHADGSRTAARFTSPRGLRVHLDGRLFVADTGNHLIREVSAAGLVSTLAGTPGIAGRTDGPAASATFSFPSDLRLSGDGSLRIVDTGNHLVRDLSPTGQVSTHSGLTSHPGLFNASGAAARFDSPRALAATASALFVADVGNSALRRVALDDGFSVTTLAHVPLSADAGLAATPDASSLYLSAPDDHTVVRVDAATGAITPLAGAAGQAGVTNGPAADARFHTPRGLAVDSLGRLYIADSANHVIRRFDPASGAVSAFAGLAGAAGSLDATGNDARFSQPAELAIDADDNLVVLESSARRLRRITPEGVVTTIHSDTAQTLDHPRGLAIDSRGRIYLTDRSHRVFIFPPGGRLGVLGGVAGSPGAEDRWDKTTDLFGYPADSSRFNAPGALAVGPDDTLYIADTGNSTLRRARTKLEYLLREPTETSIIISPTGTYDRHLTRFQGSVAHDIEITAAPADFYLLKEDGSIQGAGAHHAHSQHKSASNLSVIGLDPNLFPQAPDPGIYVRNPAPGVYQLLLSFSYHDIQETVPYTVQIKPTSYQTSLIDSTFYYDGTPKEVAINAPPSYVVTDIRYQPYYYTWQPIDPAKGSPAAPIAAGDYYVTARFTSDGAGIHETFTMRILPAERRETIVLNAGDIPPLGAAAYDPLAGRPGYAGSAHYELMGGPATVSGNLVTVHAPGSVVLRYKPASNTSYLSPYQYVRLNPSDPISYRASATVTVLRPDNLTYDGAPHPVTVTTEPPGLDVLIQYERQVNWPNDAPSYTEAPIDAGEYYVITHVISPGYEGYATQSLTIAKAAATIQLASEPFVFDGTYRKPPVLVTTTPPGLPTQVTMPPYYSENGYYYFRPGSYAVSASLDSSLKLNYTAEPAQGTITCLRRPLTIRLNPASRAVGTSNLPFTFSYDGKLPQDTNPPKPVATTSATWQSPPGLYPVTLALGTDPEVYDVTLIGGDLEVFTPASGRHEALLLDPATGLPEGKLTLRITPGSTGTHEASYTGTLVVRDGAFSVKGVFAHVSLPANPDFNYIVSSWTLPYPRGIAPIRYRLELSLEDVLIAKLHGYREYLGKPVIDSPFVLESEPAPGLLPASPPASRPSWAGRHTLLMRGAQPFAATAIPAPVAPGFATATLDAKDVLSLRGKLGDGQPFTASAPLAADQSSRLFVSPYKRPDSHLAGWLRFLPHPTLAGRLHVSADTGSDLYWRKTANPSDSAHRRGLAPLALTATIDPWTPLPAAFVFPEPHVQLAPHVASPSTTFEAARIKLDAKTGLFTQRITILDPELAARFGLSTLAKRTLTASGILRQPPLGDTLSGAGQFMLPLSPEFIAQDIIGSEIVYEADAP